MQNNSDKKRSDNAETALHLASQRFKSSLIEGTPSIRWHWIGSCGPKRLKESATGDSYKYCRNVLIRNIFLLGYGELGEYLWTSSSLFWAKSFIKFPPVYWISMSKKVFDRNWKKWWKKEFMDLFALDQKFGDQKNVYNFPFWFLHIQCEQFNRTDIVSTNRTY